MEAGPSSSGQRRMVSHALEQVMSPSEQSAELRSALLEGEDRGPSYGAVDPTWHSPGLVNGVGPEDVLSTTVPDATTGASVNDGRHAQRTSTVATHAQLEQATQPQPLAYQQATAAAVAEGLPRAPVVEHVHQQVNVAEVTFSPPEDLPAPEGERTSGAQGQPVWMLRLGEFLQRRVSQAGAMMTPILESRTTRSTGAPVRTPSLPLPRSWSGGQPPGLFTPEAEHAMQQWARQAPLLHGSQPHQGSDSSSGSLTREQVLLEVQRQVSKEMQSFNQQRAALEAENKELKEALQRTMQHHRAQVTGLQEGHGQGNPAGPQGSVSSRVDEGRGGNPSGPCAQAPVDRGDPLGRQQDPSGYGGELQTAVGGSGVHLGAPGVLPMPGQVRSDDPRDVPRDFPVLEGYPRVAHGGQGQQPPRVVGSREGEDGSGRPGGFFQGSGPRTASNEGGQFRPPDPLGLLVQGMTQLQSAVSESLRTKAKELEIVKPGTSELPRLADLSENSAIDVGDWLHGLQNHMGDLSNGSGLWWREIMLSLAAYYDAYTRASHVGKLSLRPEDYESEELKDTKWARVDKRAASMLLSSVPDSVRDEILASRLTGTLSILARVIVLYRPGSVVERQQVLASLESPPQATTAADAVSSLRRWSRWMARATDLGIQRPDPSVLLRGLDSLCQKPLQDAPEVAFRINMLRYTLEIDVRPTEKGVKDLHQALVSEFEQIAYRGSTASSSKVLFVKSIGTSSSSPPPPRPTLDTSASPTNQPKPKGKAATPCKFFMSDAGCSKGRACTWSHAFTRKEKQGRCWSCGSTQHQQSACPIKSEGSPTGKAKGGAPKAPSLAQLASPGTGASGSSQPSAPVPIAAAMSPPPPTSSTTSSGPDGIVKALEVPDVEVKQLLQEANAMLKEMRQLKTLALSATQVENMAVGHGCSPSDGRTGLLDSGASHPFRVATEEEIERATRVRVQLADGGEVVLAQNKGGTLLAASPKEGDAATPIVPLGALVQDLGCDVSWTRKKGLEIRHPEHGIIRPQVVGPCPVVGEARALDLIKELEDLKISSLRASTASTARSIWTWDQDKAWSQHLDSFLASGTRASQLQALSVEDSPFRWASEVDKSYLAEGIDLSSRAGWDYLKAFPVSRQTRKRMMSSQWVVHLFAGKGKGVDPVLRELEDGVVMLEIDITRSMAFDMFKMNGVYRGLLWGAATGKISGIFGAPPCRGDRDVQLVLKQMWLSMVAKAARSNSGSFPVFALMEGRRLFEIVKGAPDHRWNTLRDVWPAFVEQMCLEEVGDVMATNLDFSLPLEITTGVNGTWTDKFKLAVVEAVARWKKEPEAVQVVKWAKKIDVKGFLESFSDKDLKMWRAHVRNNHQPYNRNCRTCVSSTGVGRLHKRVKHPSAHCLSLDIAGPFRVRASDPDHSDYRYMLVGAYTYPRLEPEVGRSSKKKKGGKDGPRPDDGHLGEPQPDGGHSGEPRPDGGHLGEPRPDGGHLGEPRPDGGHLGEPRPDGGHPGEPRPYGGRSGSSVGPDREDLLRVLLGGDESGADGQESAVAADARGEGGEDPFEEVVEEDYDDNGAFDLKGLTQEEFEQIFYEVGDGIEFDTFYVARPLRSRVSSEVCSAVQELFLTLKAEGLPISRVHADRARELRTVPLRRWLLERGALCTYTEGQAPQANGRAESAVKWIKSQARKLLTATSLPRSCWAMAVVYATWARREVQLGRGRDVLPFGTPVHVRTKVYGVGGHHDLNLKWKSGQYVGPSLDVRGGHVVRFEDGTYLTTAHLRPHLVDSDKLVDLGKYEAMLLTPAKRVKSKSTLTEVADSDPLDVDTGDHNPEHPAEQYALGLLGEDHLEPEQLEVLAYMLPGTSAIPKRFGVVEDAQKIWSSGAFVHGGVVGVKRSTMSFPMATRAFVKYVKQLAPDHEFTSVAVNVNVQARGHKDVHNVNKNMVVALSAFKEGGLDVDTEAGPVTLDLAGGPKFFSPKDMHTTRPWSNGNRVVLLAYSVRDNAKLSEEHADVLKDIGFHWTPHLSRPAPSSREVSLKALRVGLLREYPRGTSSESPSQVSFGDGVEAEVDAPAQNLGQAEDPGRPDRASEPLEHVRQDFDLVLQDLEDRAARLRDLLEEEEILSEEYRRVGEEARAHLSDARDQVAQYLEDVHSRFSHVESLRAMTFLKAVRASGSSMSGSSSSSQDEDYESLLDALEEDLQVVYTVPLPQVRAVLTRWVTAMRKEIENLVATGTVREVPVSELRSLEKQGKVVVAPAKCVFTLKPPARHGDKYKRKCRLVICGNFLADEGGNLYASGVNTDSLRLALVLAASKRWWAAISDITGAFLLAPWPDHLPRYGLYPPRVVREAQLVGDVGWILERPLYGLRESPSVWASHRDARLRSARIAVGEMLLVLRQTLAESELWMVLDDVSGILVGLLVTYVDDILYLSEVHIVNALHAFVLEEWPASALEWVNEKIAARYLGVEILWEPASGSFSISQSAYIADLLRAHNLQDTHSTLLPVPREWVEQAEADLDETEVGFDEETLKGAQRAVGEALWLATKSRPDILFVVNHMSSVVSRQPSYVLRVGQRVLSYLAGTSGMKLMLGPRSSSPGEVVCFTDASYAPFGRRSFGAAVVTVQGAAVAWKAGRQSFVTLSVMEAELYAATQGCLLLESVFAILEEVCPGAYCRVLAIDNTSAAAMCNGGHGSQRTRHLKIRAAFIREATSEGRLQVRHTPGELQLADLATKLQPRLRLWRLLNLWGFVGEQLTGMVNAFKTKLLSVLVVLSSLLVPVTGEAVGSKKEPLATTGWQELTLLLIVSCVAVIGLWEAGKALIRAFNRWTKASRRTRKLKRVSEYAAEAAKREVAIQAGMSLVSDQASSLHFPSSTALSSSDQMESSSLRQRATGERPQERTPPPRRRLSEEEQPMYSPGAQSSVREGHEDLQERERVVRDVLRLLTCEELKAALRSQGLLTSGLKDDLILRLLPVFSLISERPDMPTVRQLKFLLWLWREKSLKQKCLLRWTDIFTKTAMSQWLFRWKD